MTDSANTTPAIEAKDLGFFYRAGTKILDGLSFSFKEGGIHAILGLNGCGKTTLLKIMLGVLKPKAGSLKISQSTAFVPQLFQAVFSFSSLDMVLMGRMRHIGLFARPSREDERLALLAMDKLGILDFATRPYPELSGGQRQLVILARALVSEAKILILDEPASALDLGNQARVMRRMSQLREEEGLTVVFTTHSPQHALSIADDVLLMCGKGDYLSGPASEVLTEANLSKVYHTEVKLVEFERNGKPEKALVPIFT
ncbi:MAG: ABC transporter ATP-binding protein [Deltaproteobacteria bacterium]|jgi:iron complex transport system ATP-binding protein|nr:ABC transporter ATP-binding protein [Deltaproteobacteria bacterium]